MNKSLPTEEELELVRDYCILPIMLTIVENNKREMEYSTYSLRGLYVAAADKLMDRIHADLVQVRKVMRAKKFKVVEAERKGYVDTALDYTFYCRGYEFPFSLMKAVIKYEISVRLGKYIAELFKKRGH
ncbi:hypothetical protein AB6A23_11110 [Paenibacillus tarimensis]